MSGKSMNAADSFPPYSGWHAPGRSGDCFRKSTAIGTPSTAALRAGLSRASSMSCIKLWLMIPTWSTYSLTQPSFAPTPALPVREKKRWAGGASLRSQSRRLFHQDSHRGGCSGQSLALALNCRTAPRQPTGSSLALSAIRYKRAEKLQIVA